VGRVAGAKSIVLRKPFSFMPRGALCNNNTDGDAGDGEGGRIRKVYSTFEKDRRGLTAASAPRRQ